MLTYPITMMFWKIVKYTQTHGRVIAWAVGPTSPTQGPGGLPLPGAPWNLCIALGGTGLCAHPAAGRAELGQHPPPQGTAAPEPLCSG